MRGLTPFCMLLFLAGTAHARSAHVSIFESSHLRAIEGLKRQHARRSFAREEYRRYASLVESGAVSAEAYEMARAVKILTSLDFEIAELKARQAEISLELAEELSELGRPIPICKRVKQSDEDSAASILKELTRSKGGYLVRLVTNLGAFWAATKITRADMTGEVLKLHFPKAKRIIEETFKADVETFLSMKYYPKEQRFLIPASYPDFCK